MTAPFDRSVPASSWGPMVAPPCDTGASHTSSQFTPSNMAIYVIGMLLLWLKWIGWSRRRQLCFAVSSGDGRPLSSRRPLKLDNPAKLCWFHAIAQCASATILELRPDVEFSHTSHVGQVLTALGERSSPCPLALRQSAIVSLDVGANCGCTIRRGLVDSIIAHAGLHQRFSIDLLCVDQIICRSSPSAQTVVAGVEVQPAGNGSDDTHAIAFVFVAGVWWRCDDDRITHLAKAPVTELFECAVLFCVG